VVKVKKYLNKKHPKNSISHGPLVFEASKASSTT